MQETTTMTVQEHVHAVIAGRIIQRLTKLSASEESTLLEAIATSQRQDHLADDDESHGYRHATTTTIPRSVITDVLKTLAELGRIRRFRYNGVIFIATRNATREDIIAAIKRNAESTGSRRRKPLAEPISYFEAANVPELGDSSQEDDAYTFEGNTTSQLDAEIIPSLNNERFDAEPAAKKPISALAARRIAYQLERPHIPANNTRNARRRWLKTEDGAEWIRIQQLARETLEAEQIAFSA